MAQREQSQTGASFEGGGFFSSPAVVNSPGFIFYSSLALRRCNCHLTCEQVYRQGILNR